MRIFFILISIALIAIMAFRSDKTRYFLVTYSAETETAKSEGNIYFKQEQFPSIKFMTEQASKRSGIDQSRCIITNIIELKSKEDFDSLTK